jgi:hypothetical protein
MQSRDTCRPRLDQRRLTIYEHMGTGRRFDQSQRAARQAETSTGAGKLIAGGEVSAFGFKLHGPEQRPAAAAAKPYTGGKGRARRRAVRRTSGLHDRDGVDDSPC